MIRFHWKGAKYGLEGTDGLKTGSSDTAGFELVRPLQNGGTRVWWRL